MHEIIVEDVVSFLEREKRTFDFVFSDLPYEMDIIGNVWDRSGIAFDTNMYKLLLNRMKPGAFGVFYGFSRTHHRVMVALEDAGWLIHKTIFAWVYPDGNAQGAQNTSKRLDKIFASMYGGFCECGEPNFTYTDNKGFINPKFANLGIDVDFCMDCHKPIKKVLSTIQHSKTGGMKKIGGPGYGNSNIQEITEPLTVESAAMQNRVYSLGFGKPILEPLIVVQAPYETYRNEAEIHNVVRTGMGTVSKSNRHPGNFLFMHHPECTPDGECHAGCLSNTLKYKYQDFYYNLSEDLDAYVFSHTRAKQERHTGLSYPNPHPSVKPLAVDEWVAKLFLPPEIYGPFTAFNPLMGSGSEMIGLRRAGWDNVVGLDFNPVFAKTAYDRNLFYFPGEEIKVSGKQMDD